MISEREVLNIFDRLGVVLRDGHFGLASGRHSSVYFNKNVLGTEPLDMQQVCRALAECFVGDNIGVVVGPAMGGVVPSFLVALHLSEFLGSGVRTVYAEKVSGSDELVLKRGFGERVAGRRVLIVEDVLTTGESAQKTIAVVGQAGGNVVALGAFCDRRADRLAALDGVPKLVALTELDSTTWSADKCPLCARGIPLNTEIGRGA